MNGSVHWNESIGSSANKIKLNFNHPVKNLSGLFKTATLIIVHPHMPVIKQELVLQAANNVVAKVHCMLLMVPSHLTTLMPDVLPNSVFNYVPLQGGEGGNNTGFVGEPDTDYCDEILNSAYGLSDATSMTTVGCDAPATGRTGTVSTAGYCCRSSCSRQTRWGQNPVVTAKLQQR